MNEPFVFWSSTIIFYLLFLCGNHGHETPKTDGSTHVVPSESVSDQQHSIELSNDSEKGKEKVSNRQPKKGNWTDLNSVWGK
ncbi:hypothetical protein NPIL_457641 [Nephila pilipes]|uniref:Uncharacterized protein n=1 Tax=Nephila pilipes TaxID=299642 RepID=A0A8X6URA2_NEPPI|nr:hypothetical protein NPIL_457641 [Nephila pilipes]